MSLPLHLWRPLKPIGERSASSTSLVEPACLQLVRAARAFRKGVQARHVPANARSSHHREPVPRLAAVDDVISSACNGAPSRAERPLPSSYLNPHADTVQNTHRAEFHSSCLLPCAHSDCTYEPPCACAGASTSRTSVLVEAHSPRSLTHAHMHTHTDTHSL